MDMHFLGETGLRVSAFALGTMGFGGGAESPVGHIDKSVAQRMVSMALDAGINLVDTSNSYSGGRSEELLGEALVGRRDDILISTKVHARAGTGPNDVGQSRHSIVTSCERSLRRLQTEHIDILHVHGFDGCTALEESLGALDRLVRSGKVRYIACSNYAAWQLVHALSVSERRNFDRYVAMQAYYSLVGREIEWEILPACREFGLGLLVWSPLAGGLLSGKFSRGHTPEGTRRSMVGDLGVGHVDEELAWRVLDECHAIAKDRSVSVAQVSLNWVRGADGVSSVITAARTVEQLADNLAAAEWQLSAEERERLNAASAIRLPYPHWFQRQFTAERYSKGGPPDPTAAHVYLPPAKA